MPYVRELELAVAATALWRRWPSQERGAADALLAEIRRLASAPPGDWLDVPLRAPAEGYAEWSKTYDAPGNWIVQLDDSAMSAALRSLPPGRVLDAACGTGRHAAFLADRGHEVIGVDASPEMLARARARVPAADLRSGELTALPLEDASVELAVCSLALTHVQELRPALAELARVVGPGGRLVLSDVHPCCVLLGGQGLYRTEAEPAGYVRNGYVRNHLHWHGSYLAAFAAAGLEVEACHDVPLTRAETDVIARSVDLDAELAAEALVGVPGILLWELAKPSSPLP